VFLGISAFSQSGTLKIIVSGIQNNKGNIKVALYNKSGSSGFLKALNLSYRKKEVSISGKKALVTFKNIPYGTYALALFQDENNNGIIDRAPIGFPVEPYGISGNKKTFGPPSFNDGKFELNSENLTLKVEMKSYLKNNF